MLSLWCAYPSFYRGRTTHAPAALPTALAALPVASRPGALQYVLHTAVGPGPRVLPEAVRVPRGGADM